MLGMAKIFKTIDCIWIGFQKGNIYSICTFFTHTTGLNYVKIRNRRYFTIKYEYYL
nr:MAG TPA: protein of unknown function DUF4547 [Caudoviricetes sp.]